MRRLLTAVLLALAVSCTNVPEAGVPLGLARERKAEISDVRYRLTFDIPASPSQRIDASEEVSFVLASRRRVALDFKEDPSHLVQVSVDGRQVPVVFANEHVVIPRRYLRRGANSIRISFVAGEQSLNRRDGFLYTLLVPDRARTLFPCFDQPDLKAEYTLSLTVPEGWTAVSNTAIAASEGRTVTFAPTEPLSTYLFSFVAGEFSSTSAERDGRRINMYYRETDERKLAQCDEVLSLVCASLTALEEYTGVPYPFAKYDLIVLPDFQYGGMEHTGATLYNDRRIFLGERPTTSELLSRASLIAHETAHMWFGDYVTMRWFNDVWTKEVFANHFASKIVSPLFPQVDGHLGDMRSYWAASYNEDRTPGSNAIRRPLGNLDKAGLIYCNIIYDKAPVVMDKLERALGPDLFRAGIRNYLRDFGYANADWDDLIASFPQKQGLDLREWSHVWIDERGMPEYAISCDGGHIRVTQRDPFDAGNIWRQDVELDVYGGGVRQRVTVDADAAVKEVQMPFKVDAVIPNADGYTYGWFRLDDVQARFLMDAYCSLDDDAERFSVLMTLFENTLRGVMDADEFIAWTASALQAEKVGLVADSMMGYASRIAAMHGGSAVLERALSDICHDVAAPHEKRLLALRTLSQISRDVATADELLAIWQARRPFKGMVLGENDYSSLATQLMLRFPEKASDIRTEQISRLSNQDRRATFAYVSKAALADVSVRDSLFATMLTPEGRRNESRVRSALSLLCHPLRGGEALKYIRPALDVLEDVQRTGDIFFPQNWCSSLLSGQQSPAAREIVERWLDEHRDLDPLLRTKVLQNLADPFHVLDAEAAVEGKGEDAL